MAVLPLALRILMKIFGLTNVREVIYLYSGLQYQKNLLKYLFFDKLNKVVRICKYDKRY